MAGGPPGLVGRQGWWAAMGRVGRVGRYRTSRRSRARRNPAADRGARRARPPVFRLTRPGRVPPDAPRPAPRPAPAAAARDDVPPRNGIVINASWTDPQTAVHDGLGDAPRGIHANSVPRGNGRGKAAADRSRQAATPPGRHAARPAGRHAARPAHRSRRAGRRMNDPQALSRGAPRSGRCNSDRPRRCAARERR